MMDIAAGEPETQHISHQIIQSIINKDKTQLESQEISKHLNECERCSNLVEMIQYAQEISTNAPTDAQPDHPSRLELSETINKIYEGSLAQNEAANFLDHLASCSRCFKYIVTVFEETFSPLSDDIISELDAYSKVSLAKQVLKKIPPKPESSSFLKNSIEKIKPQLRFQGILTPQFGFGALTFIILISGSIWGTNFYKTTYRIHQAANLIEENYRVYQKGKPRMSGGYASKGIDIVMAPPESTETPPSYLSQALNLTERAIANGSESPRAKHLQAQIFFIQKDYQKADSVLNKLDEKARNSAAILNDLGVLKISQEDWQAAAHYFESALQADSKFREAYYNIALVQDRLGETENAISSIKEYLALEKDEGWKAAGLNLLQKLQSRED